MTQAMERRQTSAAGVRRQFGDLPPAASSLDLDRALELAGVDAAELALLAATTFKECQTLEELVTLVATTRRRGLDPLLKQVYYEKFGGDSSGPSLHIAIDGLRVIAVKTGRYVGAGEPRYSDTYDMQTGEAAATTKPVPAKCVVTVFANNGGRVGAFEGVAFMDECYPGAGPRGRMWRARPRGMLAVAAERQALRRAFPAETAGLVDVDEGEAPLPARTVVVDGPTQQQQAATYERIYGDTERVVNTTTGEVIEPPAQPQLNRGELRERWGLLTGKARDLGVEYVPIGNSISDAEALVAVQDLERRIREAEASLAHDNGV
jgi:phage recombination protein Bet